MTTFVRSFADKIGRFFQPPVVGRRAANAFPGVFQRWWNTLPSYLPFYIIVPIVLFAVWYGLQPATVIMPFHLPPEDKAHPLPFGGDAVADTLQDAITSIRQEASGHDPLPPCDFPWQKKDTFGGLMAGNIGSFEVRGPVLVEVKGISPEALVSAAREVFGNERYISGNVLIAPKGFQLLAQANDRGPWMTGPQEISLNGLKITTCEMAEDIIGATNKNVLAAAWIRRHEYTRVIDLYRNLPEDSTDADALNNLGVALRMTGRTDDALRRLQAAVSLKTCYYRLGDPFARFSDFIQGKCFPEGHFNLANVLDDQKSYDAAIYHYRKAIELKPDFVTARSNLGRTLRRKGHHDDEAIREFHKAIEAGDASAMRSLGYMYLKGYGVKPEPDYHEAVIWFQKAADLKDADGMNDLGFMYEKGHWVTQDYKQAFDWYQKAAEAGSPHAMFHLGELYREGHGVERNYNQALRWYSGAADGDDSESMTWVGFMYEKGLGVKQDYKQAFEWYKKAAKAGDPMGMTNLGVKYEEGNGVQQDYTQAFSWYRKAAEAGDPPGMYNLGISYEYGKGVQPDKQQAINWYRKAAQLGDQSAKDALKRLGESP
jgi:TPR repeat protein